MHLSENAAFSTAQAEYPPGTPTNAAVAPLPSSGAPGSASNDRLANGQAVASAVPLPSLDPDESNPQNGSCADVAFRHSWWRRDRAAIDSVLQAVFPDSKRLSRFRDCGNASWVFASRTEPGKYKVCCDSCRDRWCRSCQRDRSRIIATNLRKRLEGSKIKLVTLTLRHRDQPLRSQIDRLLDCFRTLRRKPLWAAAVLGGVAFVEVTWNAATRRWHPHLHILCTGSYLPQPLLSGLWSQITGGSFICDVRAVTDLDKVAAYVVKYASKPMNTAIYRDQRALREAVDALQGRHLCITFGEFRGWKLTTAGDGDDWLNIGTLCMLREKASQGDRDSQAVLDCLRRDERPPELPEADP